MDARLPTAHEAMSALIYVASPLGFSEPGRYFYKGILLPALSNASFRVADPWEGAELDMDADRTTTHFQAFNVETGEKNERMLRACDAVLAVVDGTDVDSGTAAEIGFAAATDKPI